jgi:hypothetical protein
MNRDGNDSFFLDIETRHPVPGRWEKTAYIKLRLTAAERDANGHAVLSPDLRCPQEVYESADGLIKELERIKRSAAAMQWDNYPRAVQR